MAYLIEIFVALFCICIAVFLIYLVSYFYEHGIFSSKL